ncbi:MAG: polysaccharide deacetylase [Ruminococcaceae bacterium]|nr:polysaccharide deacetylase [Oscillospiraceae bacterium]
MPRSIFMRYPGGLAKALTLSYDDGVVEDIRMVEILNRHGMKCTFNINSGRYPAQDAPENAKHVRLSEAQVTKLLEHSPHEVAVHTLEHPFLASQPTAAVCHEVLQDRLNLEKQFHRIVRGMAYPMGSFSDGVVEALRACGIAYARTTVSTQKFDLPTDWLRMPATCRHKDPKLMELANRFLELNCRDFPKLFYLWGHTYEFAEDNNWELMERFAELMGGRNDIWYATNGELYDYVQDYQRLEWSVDETILHNPTARTLWFAYGFPYAVEVAEIAPNETKYLN